MILYCKKSSLTKPEISIIRTPGKYTRSDFTFCEENSKHCLPNRELSDAELLQIIYFDHKVSYCFDRLYSEIQMGLRDSYPIAE